MKARPALRKVMAVWKPYPTSPTTFSLGTRQSSKTSSAWFVSPASVLCDFPTE